MQSILSIFHCATSFFSNPSPDCITLVIFFSNLFSYLFLFALFLSHLTVTLIPIESYLFNSYSPNLPLRFLQPFLFLNLLFPIFFYLILQLLIFQPFPFLYDSYFPPIILHLTITNPPTLTLPIFFFFFFFFKPLFHSIYDLPTKKTITLLLCFNDFFFLIISYNFALRTWL